MSILELTVTEDFSRLVVLNDQAVLVERTWSEERDMGRQLFTAIEAVLLQSGLAAEAIAEFRIVSDLPDSSTSRRIAETVKRVYTFGVQTRGSGYELRRINT